MVQGILLSLASGLLFGTVGAILRRVSRAGGNLVTYYVLFGTFYLALALLFQVRWRVVAGVDRLPMLALVIGLAGVVSGLGMLLMTRSMALGHGGISWAISQSALVVPFLAGVLLEGDRGVRRPRRLASPVVDPLAVGRVDRRSRPARRPLGGRLPRPAARAVPVRSEERRVGKECTG